MVRLSELEKGLLQSYREEDIITGEHMDLAFLEFQEKYCLEEELE